MNDDLRQLLDENILGAVGTVNENGSPWVTPVHVFFDNDAIYWFSHAKAQHSQNIAREARVSVTVWSPDESKGIKGVYLNGLVQTLSGDEATAAATQLVLDRLGSIPRAFEGASAYRLPIGVLDKTKSYGNCWYFYS